MIKLGEKGEKYTMDANYKNNMEINILDLFWNIVYRWKIILLVAVLGTVLGVGYKVYSNVGVQRNMEAMQENSGKVEILRDDEIASLENSLTELECANVDFALAYSEKLEERQRYKEESTYINLDADAINCVTITYMINNGYTFSYQEEVQPNNATALKYAYVDYINNGMLISDIADSLHDIAISDLRELISAGQSSDTNAIEMIGVNVYGKDAAQAKRIAAEVEKAIGAYSKQVNSEVGEHELKLIGDASVIVSDADLAAAQNSLDAVIIDYKTKIVNYRQAFSDAQKKLYDLLADKEDDQMDQDIPDPVDEPTAVTEKVGLFDGAPKFGVLGCAAGVFLVCMIIVCIYLFNGYVKTAEEFSDLFGLYLLGDYDEITEGKSKLEKLRRKQKWTLDEKRELTIANLKVLCKKYGIDQIYLASTLHLEKDAVQEMDAIVSALHESNIEAVWGENVLRDAAAMELMSSYEYVVLVEKTNMSRYASVAQLLTARNEQNNKSLGVIVL